MSSYLNRTKQEHNVHSEDDLNDQINDKLSELWTGMRNKKKQLLRNLTPGYSRRSERTLSELNATNTNLTSNLTNNHSANENQLLKVKEKLASEESNRKLKQTEIERLKNTIAQLTNDKKILINQIQHFGNHSISISHLNQEKHDDPHVDGRTANFYGKEKKKKESEVFGSKRDKWYGSEQPNKREKSCVTEQGNKQNESYGNNGSTKHFYEQERNRLEDLGKQRLIQLLRSTSEYREFAFYYDSHELSYLKRLQQQHKKNCQNNYSSVEKKYWAPTQILSLMKEKNAQQKWGLSQLQLEQVISQMKGYFEANEELRLRQTKDYYTRKIDKLKREKENKLPYDLVRLSNARERQICKKRAKSITATKSHTGSKSHTLAKS